MITLCFFKTLVGSKSYLYTHFVRQILIIILKMVLLAENANSNAVYNAKLKDIYKTLCVLYSINIPRRMDAFSLFSLTQPYIYIHI